MNICIGGCWHGSKLLTNGNSRYFHVNGSKPGDVGTRYKRFEARYRGRKYIFWVDRLLSHEEVNQKILPYLNNLGIR